MKVDRGGAEDGREEAGVAEFGKTKGREEVRALFFVLHADKPVSDALGTRNCWKGFPGIL